MSDQNTRPRNLSERGEQSRFPAPLGKPARRILLGTGILVASLGFALVAASQSRPDLLASRLGLPSIGAPGTANPGMAGAKASAELATAAEIKSPVGMIKVADLQRRGNSLVGEVKTRDGAVMRLVFDARTHALIGMRVLDPVEQPPP